MLCIFYEDVVNLGIEFRFGYIGRIGEGDAQEAIEESLNMVGFGLYEGDRNIQRLEDIQIAEPDVFHNHCPFLTFLSQCWLGQEEFRFTEAHRLQSPREDRLACRGDRGNPNERVRIEESLCTGPSGNDLKQIRQPELQAHCTSREASDHEAFKRFCIEKFSGLELVQEPAKRGIHILYPPLDRRLVRTPQLVWACDIIHNEEVS